MQKYIDSVQGETGTAISGATVRIYDTGTTTLAPIYSNNSGSSKANPMTTDDDGMFEFYAADGRYDINVTYGTTTKTISDVLLEDPEDDSSSDIDFTPSGTGAVTRSAQTKMRDYVSSGDHSTSQQSAIDAIGKTFFVPASATLTLTVPTDVATLNDAITGIQKWVIPSSSSVTIKVPSLSLSSPTTFSHAYGERVFIEGNTAKVTTTVSAAGAVTGSAGAWSVPLTVNSATGIAANDYAIVSAVTGTGAYKQFLGLCKISSVVGTTVTVLNTDKSAAWATASLSTANLTVVKNIITYTGCDGFRIDSALGGLSNVVIVGNKTAGTIGLITNGKRLVTYFVAMLMVQALLVSVTVGCMRNTAAQ
jgi:hypothetical protein